MSITATTTVTETELRIAEGGPADTWVSDDLVVVECPADYDPTLITAEDIVEDPAITLLTMNSERTDTCRCCGTEVAWTFDLDDPMTGGWDTYRPTDGAGLITCDDCYDDATGYIHEDHG